MAAPTSDRRRANGNEKRARILKSVRELYAQHHRPTTYREIAEHSGVSMGSIEHNLPTLVRDGLIRRLPGMRSIEPAPVGRDGEVAS